MYKIGDTVIVKKIKGNPEDYPYTYVEGMYKHCGERAKIIDIRVCTDLRSHIGRRYYNHDIYEYFLDITDYAYIWSSSMFSPCSLNSPNFVPLSSYVQSRRFSQDKET